MSNDKKNIVFFGTSRISVIIFESLRKYDITPLFLVTTPDKPQGRHLTITPPPAKVWAQEHAIEVLQPEKLKAPPFADIIKEREPIGGFDVFIVASYGKIIPKEILSIPNKGIINIHPSLLPLYRGPSPIPSQILSDDKAVGVSIMLMDEEMDHGPIITQEQIPISNWPLSTSELKKILGEKGALILKNILPDWIEGKIKSSPQNHIQATYTKKFEKADGEITLTADPYKNYLLFQALKDITGVFFFEHPKEKIGRVKITKASFESGKFIIHTVIPEGKKEMPYLIYQQNILNKKTH